MDDWVKWSDSWLDRPSTKAALAVACFVLGYVIRWVTEWRKKIRFVASGWSLQYAHQDSLGQVHYKDEPPVESGKKKRGGHPVIRYKFMVEAFNKKSTPVGLHRFSVQFTKGPWLPWRGRSVVFRDDVLLHGDHVALGQMMLPPNAWAVENIVGYIREAPNAPDADAVWFVAYSAEGKRFRWRVADLKPPPA